MQPRTLRAASGARGRSSFRRTTRATSFSRSTSTASTRRFSADTRSSSRLALPAAGPEVAADDYVDLEGARTVYAGLVLDHAGPHGRARRQPRGLCASMLPAPASTSCSMRPAASGIAAPTPPAATRRALRRGERRGVLALRPRDGRDRRQRRDLARDAGRSRARSPPSHSQPTARSRSRTRRRNGRSPTAPCTATRTGCRSRRSCAACSARESGLSTGCTKHCGNVDYSKCAKSGVFRRDHPCTSLADPLS